MTGSTKDRDKVPKSKSIELLDFGARIKIVSSDAKSNHGIRLEISLRQDSSIHEDSVRYLRGLYGPSVMMQRLEDGQTVIFVLSVCAAVQKFDSIPACALSLSRIRVQAVGAPIFKAFSRLQRTSDVLTHSNDNDFQCKLGSYERCGTFHCLSTDEK